MRMPRCRSLLRLCWLRSLMPAETGSARAPGPRTSKAAAIAPAEARTTSRGPGGAPGAATIASAEARTTSRSSVRRSRRAGARSAVTNLVGRSAIDARDPLKTARRVVGADPAVPVRVAAAAASRRTGPRQHSAVVALGGPVVAVESVAAARVTAATGRRAPRSERPIVALTPGLRRASVVAEQETCTARAGSACANGNGRRIREHGRSRGNLPRMHLTAPQAWAPEASRFSLVPQRDSDQAGTE